LPESRYGYHDKDCGSQCYQGQPCVPDEQAKGAFVPAPEPVIAPTATTAYKRLAEPLADWVANYVWKVCTTGTNLPLSRSVYVILFPTSRSFVSRPF
jgi:hypothetical protein